MLCMVQGASGTGLLTEVTQVTGLGIVTEMASEVTVKGCGGQAIRQLSQAPTAWQVTLPCFPGPGLLTQEPLLPHAGAPRRKHQASKKGGGAGKQTRPPKTV